MTAPTDRGRRPQGGPARVGPGLAGAAAWWCCPFCVAVLLAALLHPVTSWLRRHGPRRALAALVSLLLGVVVLGGLLSFATMQVVAGYPALAAKAGDLVSQVADLAQRIPGTSSFGLGTIEEKVLAEVQANVSSIAGGVLAAGTAVGEVATALVVTVFVTFFFVDQGDRMFAWAVRPFPRGAQPSGCGAGYRAWYVLSGWIGGTAVVAAGNAALLYLTGVEDVHGNRRRGGDRTEPMEPPAYAPLPFLGIEQEVAAVRYEPSGGPGGEDGAKDGREPVHAPRPDAAVTGR